MFKVQYTVIVKGSAISEKGVFGAAKKDVSEKVSAEIYKVLSGTGNCGSIKSVQCIETRARSF